MNRREVNVKLKSQLNSYTGLSSTVEALTGGNVIKTVPIHLKQYYRCRLILSDISTND